jgi:hypothetical protein
MIDPKIWESEQVMNLSPFEFKVYIFLISSADDEGRLKVSYPIFVARIYPDGKFKPNTIQNALYHMRDIELIDVYTDGKYEYIQHPNWKTYQKIDRPSVSLIPSKIDCYSANSSRGFVEDSSSPRGGLAPNRIEVNRKEVNGMEGEARSSRKEPKAAPPTATPSEVISPPLKTKQPTNPKDKQLAAAAEMLRIEDPEGYKEFIALHPQLAAEEVPW